MPILSGPTGEVPLRIRKRRIWLSIFLGSVLATFVGWKAWPGVQARTKLAQIRKTIDAGQLDEAERTLDRLLSEKPRQSALRLLRVETFRRQGRITEAEEDLQRGVELGLPAEAARREHLLLSGLASRSVEEPPVTTK